VVQPMCLCSTHEVARGKLHWVVFIFYAISKISLNCLGDAYASDMQGSLF
jgi:hypothetical protein